MKTLLRVRPYRTGDDFDRIQILQRVWKLGRLTLWVQEIDREEVPRHVVMEVGALGSTEWRSKWSGMPGVFWKTLDGYVLDEKANAVAQTRRSQTMKTIISLIGVGVRRLVLHLRCEWWHCSFCGTAVRLHRADHKVGCHTDECENTGAHLVKGKGSGKSHYQQNAVAQTREKGKANE